MWDDVGGKTDHTYKDGNKISGPKVKLFGLGSAVLHKEKAHLVGTCVVEEHKGSVGAIRKAKMGK